MIAGNNYSASRGRAIDLDNDSIIAGGYTSPKLLFENGDLTISGTLTADSVIASTVTISGLAETLSLEDLVYTAYGALTEADLEAGVGNVLAGSGNNYVLNAGPGYVAMHHKDAELIERIARREHR